MDPSDTRFTTWWDSTLDKAHRWEKYRQLSNMPGVNEDLRSLSFAGPMRCACQSYSGHRKFPCNGRCHLNPPERESHVEILQVTPWTVHSDESDIENGDLSESGLEFESCSVYENVCFAPTTKQCRLEEFWDFENETISSYSEDSSTSRSDSDSDDISMSKAFTLVSF